MTNKQIEEAGSAKDPTKNPPKGTKALAADKATGRNAAPDLKDGGAPGGFYAGAQKALALNKDGSNGKGKPAKKSPTGGAKKAK